MLNGITKYPNRFASFIRRLQSVSLLVKRDTGSQTTTLHITFSSMQVGFDQGFENPPTSSSASISTQVTSPFNAEKVSLAVNFLESVILCYMLLFLSVTVFEIA